MTLRWEPSTDGDIEHAFSGELAVGALGRSSANPRRWWWTATLAVHMRHIAKTNGEVASRATARRAVERSWSAWLKAAGFSGFRIEKKDGVEMEPIRP